jgi:hypothetical protein
MKDQVLFEMPATRERQFVAMAVVQNYLHSYEDRHKMPGTPAEIANAELYYQVNMAPEDWAFFSQIGLKLRYRQKFFDTPDMIIDLGDEKAAQFEAGNERRHLADIYGIMSGVPCRSIPIVDLLEPSHNPKDWATLDDFEYKGLKKIPSQQLLRLMDGVIAGVIGYQSWGTFLAAAMQLPVIEILPKNKNRYRLSKWDFKHFRMVEEAKGDVEFQIEQAKANIIETLNRRSKTTDTFEVVSV